MAAPFACPVCHKDLSALSKTLQNKHANDCLDGLRMGDAEDASIALAVALQNDPEAILVDRSESSARGKDSETAASVVS